MILDDFAPVPTTGHDNDHYDRSPTSFLVLSRLRYPSILGFGLEFVGLKLIDTSCYCDDVLLGHMQSVSYS